MMAVGRSVFGEVLAELLESRGIPATEENIRELAIAGGLDPDLVLARVSGETDEHVGAFTRVAKNLELSMDEMLELAWAYTLGERRA
jgi:hypothetical protein